jgi:hypothetical protein
MTRWFSPNLLRKLLLKVILSDVFGQYADRRLIVAALDPASDDELFERTQLNLPRDRDGAVWIDFVADLGDGFDATYAIATLLAKDEIQVGDITPRRGQLLIMGGDEVYPLASRTNYHRQLLDPYRWAFPDSDPESPSGVPLFCIPGNHDWYDGLVTFLALFVGRQPLRIGGWTAPQRRSYFALQLTEQWWIWCADTQLADDLDDPQEAYFTTIAQRMAPGSKIILCGPEPGWLYTRKSADAMEILDEAVSLATRERKHLRVPIVLSGDTHHYSRYSTDSGTQFITSGGGGAFMHPTHSLQDTVEMRWLNRQVNLSLNTDPVEGHAQVDKSACYPSREESRKLLIEAPPFFLTNWDFSLLLGTIYWIFSMAIFARGRPDAYVIVFLLLLSGFLGYASYQEGANRKVLLWSCLQATAHFAAIILLTWLLGAVNRNIGIEGIWWWFFVSAIEMIPLGLLFGGYIFGLFLMITCAWFDMNQNDAFSAMRLDCFKHFLRIRITDQEVTIFPIGLDRVPRRDEWQINPNWREDNPSEPAYLPRFKLRPHLIEDPIVVRG